MLDLCAESEWLFFVPCGRDLLYDGRMTRSPPPLCYVLGGYGFVGSAICHEAEARGYRVVPIGRADYAQYAGSHCDLLVLAHGSSRKYLAWRDPSADFAASVGQVEAAMNDFRAKAHVLISSIDVYPDVSTPGACRESAQIDPSEVVSPYGRNKLLAEDCLRETAPEWMILRVGGLVGEGLKKNSVRDLLKGDPIWVHPDSGYQYLNSADLARILFDLREGGRTKEVYNVTGSGVITLREIAAWCPHAVLRPEYETLKREWYEVDLTRLQGVLSVPGTYATVRAFVEDVRSGKVRLG